uniref:RNA-binding protein 39 n=1 Tax=Myxine glutinosa TaxID=7769 RepID=UPI003590120C
MADDWDIEAMLEAPYNHAKEEKRRSPVDKNLNGEKQKKRRSKSRSRSRDRKHSRERHRSRSRERRHRSRERRSSSRSKERSRHHVPRGGADRRWGGRGGFRGVGFRGGFRGADFRRGFISRSQSPHYKEKSPVSKIPGDDLSPEERDARTVFCMQLAARIRPRDLEEFFSAVGQVRDVKMISDRNSRRSKGIAYVEFVEICSVPLAIGLTGQKVLGVPIIVQASQAEKNRAAAAAAAAAANMQKSVAGPMRLYVGSLHFNITEEMLKGIFEPFGKIENCQLMMDSDTGRSKGYGFITFSDAECAKKALEQLNGFHLAGRPMKVGHVTDRADGTAASSFLDNEELERTGIDLGNTGRLQLMAKLAEGTGLQIPMAAQQALQLSGTLGAVALNPGLEQTMPSLATQCIQLSNLFTPQTELEPNWDQEIRDDVIEECNKHGGVVHIFVDKNSPQGNVYVKCPTIPIAMAAVSALHGRWFAGKMITAAYVPVSTYHNIFPDSLMSTHMLMPARS